ncbi:hypothetical protein [Thioclava sp.]|uniref:hypothetical protein n=1 Tax=Thioclava sp. TaxID=1933450 RepID=UPI003242CA4F
MTETAAEIAARYGATVAPGVEVQQIERGVSSFVTPVWDGTHLVSGESRAEYMARMKRITTQNMSAQNRKLARSRKSPKVAARRAKVAELHAQGLSNSQIIEQTGQSAETLWNDLKSQGLHANKPEPKRSVADDGEIVAKVRECIEGGLSLAKTASQIGISVHSARYIRDQHDLKPLKQKDPAARKRGQTARYRKSAENLARVKAAIADGHGFDAICKVAKVTPEQLHAYNRHHKLGIVSPKRKAPVQLDHHVKVWRKQPSTKRADYNAARVAKVEARRDQVVRLRMKGLTVPEICAELGAGASTIQRDLQERGIKAPQIKRAAIRTGMRAVWKAQQEARRAQLAEILNAETPWPTQRDLAKRLGSDPATICKDMKALGFTSGKRYGPARRAADHSDTIRRMRSDGATINTICAKVGFSRSAVMRVLRGN